MPGGIGTVFIDHQGNGFLPPFVVGLSDLCHDFGVLVDYIGRLRESGKSAMEAVEEAAVHRFRPILLTTVTTFVGLMPIMVERSVDAQFLKPAVVALAFGVLFALAVTLVMVPALYCVGEDIRGLVDSFKSRLFPGRDTAPAMEN